MMTKMQNEYVRAVLQSYSSSEMLVLQERSIEQWLYERLLDYTLTGLIRT
jgi:hypothetical protein